MSTILDESTEEFQSIKAEWLKRAEEITIKTLPSFIDELANKYKHDYGTICHAVCASAIAAAHAMNNSEQGGITGFQAGVVMWGFIRAWNYWSNKCGLRIVDYDNFLFPQYESNFDKTISKNTWEAIRKEAVKYIEKADKEYAQYLIEREKYEIDMATFVTKYPDYYKNKKHYDRLGMGTGDEWDAEKKKEESGFEFAPQEPYPPVYGNDVYQHWVSITNGVIPFGYQIKDES